MFDSKLSFTADYFIKTVDDLLFSPTLSLYLGIPAYPVANIGKTETKGYELSLSYGDEIAKNVSFNTTFNFTTAENLVEEINNGDKYIWGSGYGIPYKNLTQFRQGESPGIFWGFKTNGIFQTQSEVDAHATQSNAQPGDIRFVDVMRYQFPVLNHFNYKVVEKGEHKIHLLFATSLKHVNGNDYYASITFAFYKKQYNVITITRHADELK